MTHRPKPLSKSRFKLGLECPLKLIYSSDTDYGNAKTDDAFLEALAKGGYQVGALAQAYFEPGHLVKSLDYEESVAETDLLLQQEKVTIFEAALRHENCFVRVDILKKSGNLIELFEVKAKSYAEKDQPFWNRTFLKSKKNPKKELTAEWDAYVMDITYQTYVARKVFPTSKIEPHLMMANKEAVATESGLNQKFLVKKNSEGRLEVFVKGPVDLKSLGKKLLTEVSVEEYTDHLLGDWRDEKGRSFERLVDEFSRTLQTGERPVPEPSKNCKKCEFRISPVLIGEGKKSGFVECWTNAYRLKPTDLEAPLSLDLWKVNKDRLLADKKIFVCQINESDLPEKEGSVTGRSQSQNIRLHVRLLNSDAKAPEVELEHLNDELKKWKFPLNFIDFETAMVPIPFHAGRRPYEQIAFQFSHHVLHEDGKLEHAHEFIHREPGTSPNFPFVRALKQALETNHGTIFRYADHENTVLNQIYTQLQASNEPDRVKLQDFIRRITRVKIDKDTYTMGDRCMVDMADLTRRFYYHPLMGPSYSLKDVLPAILHGSKYLRDKYSQPIYGAPDGIRSHNFENWTWLRPNGQGGVLDPYKFLPPIFPDYDEATLAGVRHDRFFEEDSLDNGTLAMMAYNRLQYTEMSHEESQLLIKALLRYCELDTLAMVMLYEHWREVVEEAQTTSAVLRPKITETRRPQVEVARAKKPRRQTR